MPPRFSSGRLRHLVGNLGVSSLLLGASWGTILVHLGASSLLLGTLRALCLQFWYIFGAPRGTNWAIFDASSLLLGAPRVAILVHLNVSSTLLASFRGASGTLSAILVPPRFSSGRPGDKFTSRCFLISAEVVPGSSATHSSHKLNRASW